MSAKDSKVRFSDRVADYAKYRPGYPQIAVDETLRNIAINSSTRIADVGAGTGLLTEVLLGCEAEVIAIEPNEEMRAASDYQLNHNSNYSSLLGSAEDTGLADNSIDLITVAQAFHWFNLNPTKAEFGRILKPGGTIALVWNRRISHRSAFLNDYELMLSTMIPEYSNVSHANSTDEVIENFLGNNMTKHEFPNEQLFDLEALKGRLMSSSYCPAVGVSGHEDVMAELERLHSIHAEDGKVRFDYMTQVYKAKQVLG